MIFNRKHRYEDLRTILDLRDPAPVEEAVVIDLRDEALAAWEDSADLIRYDADHEAIAADARRDSVVPRDIAARR